MKRFAMAALALIGTTLTASAGIVSGYTQPTVFAVRVGTSGTSTNVGGANVTNGINIVPYQFNGSWTPGLPMSAPATGLTALTITASSTSEGGLTLNGPYLGLGGYRGGTAATGNERVVGQVNIFSGDFSTSAPILNTVTAMPNAEAYTGTSLRGVVWSDDGTRFWSSGTGGAANGGVRSNLFGTLIGSTQISNVPANSRYINIFNGNLYTTSNTTTGGNRRGLNQVGTGLPTTAIGSATSLIDLAGTSDYGLAVSPDTLTVYMADDNTTAVGGIQKWTRPDTSTPFTLATTFGTGVANIGARGLAVDFLTPNPTIYASTGEGSNNRIITFIDMGGTQTSLTTIANSGTGDLFRGVAFTPIPEPTALLALTAVGVFAIRRRRA